MSRPRLLASAAWNYSSHLYEVIVGLGLIAVIARKLDIADYGLFLLTTSLAAVLMLLEAGVPSLLPQAYIEKKVRGTPDAIQGLMTTAFIFLAILGFGAVILCFLLSLLLPGPFHIHPGSLPQAMILVVLSGVVVQIALPTRALEMLYEAFSRFDALATVHFVVVTLRALATVGFLLLGYGILALGWIQVVTVAARLAILWLVLPRVTGVARPRLASRDWSLLSPLRGKATWAALDNTARQIAMSSQSLVLGIFGSMESVAVFGVGGRIPAQLFVLLRKAMGVAFPVLAERHANQDVKGLRHAYVYACRVAWGLMVPLVLVALLGADDIIRVWVGMDYRNAADVMRWLLVGILVLTVSHPSDRVLYARGLIVTAGKMAVVESLLSLALSLLLVLPFGAVGLAAAAAIGHSVGALAWFIPTACRSVGMKTFRLIALLARDVLVPGGAMALVLAVAWLGTAGTPLWGRMLTGLLPAFLVYAGLWFHFAGLRLRKASEKEALSSSS